VPQPMHGSTNKNNHQCHKNAFVIAKSKKDVVSVTTQADRSINHKAI